MGFLNNLFKGKKDKTTNNIVEQLANPLVTSNNNLSNQFSLNIHQDLKDLLWVADGEFKNYTHKPDNTRLYEYEGIRITFSSFSPKEPSLIYTNLPIGSIDNIEIIPRPQYYPSYSELSNEQRGIYWKLLSNPYSTQYNIGYVFILYYGLERHLLEGNIDKAFRVILKLRDIHTNASFQNYSACALILTCLVRQRPDLIMEFYSSIDKEHEFTFSDNLNLLCKVGLNVPLSAKDLMRMSKTFEFTNVNYIKKYPELFLETLEELMLHKHKKTELYISDYVKSAEWRKLHSQKTQIFANMSLMDNSVDIPLLCEHFKLKKLAYDLLEETHELVKKELVMKRKDGTLKAPKKTNENKIITIRTFDTEAEKQLLNELKKAKNVLFKHFALHQIIDFYYKYRELDDKYLDMCINYCELDISLLDKVQTFHREDSKKSILRLKGVYSQKEINEQLSEITHFNGQIPAFKRLAIIHEKSKNYEKAINICNQAIEYYTKYDMLSLSEEFNKRREKLLSKLQK